MQLVVWQCTSECSARGCEGIIESLFRIYHAVALVSSTQAALIKASIMCHKGQLLNLLSNLPPHLREVWSIARISIAQTMYLLAEPSVVVRAWVNKAIKAINHDTISYYNNAHRADT